jgi:restriction system protein
VGTLKLGLQNPIRNPLPNPIQNPVRQYAFGSGKPEPTLLLQSTVLSLGAETDDGQLVTAVRLPWSAIADRVMADPEFLAYYSKHWREFEEFLAGVYTQHGFDEVVLTPPSGDFGRDVIAIKHGYCSVRILGQAKAHKPDHLVELNDVNAMLGVLGGDHQATKAMVVTTSDFAPRLRSSPIVKQYLPHRLELINGHGLAEWLRKLPQATPAAYQ